MNLSNKAKKDILEFLMRRVCAIANKEYQKRIWIYGKGPEVDSFDDTVCDFLHEGDAVLEEYKDFGITEVQYKLLKKLRDEFKAFANENDFPEQFIDTPGWNRIVQLAKEVLRGFDYEKI